MSFSSCRRGQTSRLNSRLAAYAEAWQTHRADLSLGFTISILATLRPHHQASHSGTLGERCPTKCFITVFVINSCVMASASLPKEHSIKRCWFVLWETVENRVELEQLAN